MLRENAGYVIVKSVRFENDEVVLGMNKAEQYVTWRCEPHHDHYFWGHYFSSMENAMIDFYERVGELADTFRGVWERRKLDKEYEEKCKQ